MWLTVTSVDGGPEELEAQLPLGVGLVRMIPGRDRPDYWLGRLEQPLRWIDGTTERWIGHVVLCARWQGAQIVPGATDLAVNLAYVTDLSLLDDDVLDFGKCAYVAIGTAEVTE